MWMYLPRHFAEDDPAAMVALIERVSLGELVTSNGSSIDSSAIPFLFEPPTDDEGDDSGIGRLVGHLARANEQWSNFDPDVEALAIFRGPDAYVSPAWYATKRDHGKVVPTWNYATVHVHGRIVVHDDPVWLLDLVTRLTDRHESRRLDPWAVADAPPEYIAAQLRAIVGVELQITSIEAKWKLSQNQPEANRSGVVHGLTAEGAPRQLEVAAMIEVPEVVRPSGAA
jgi:transcriptional regulator